VPPFAHDDTPALIVLATILGGWRGFIPFAAGGWQSRSNRLYRALVEAKLATDASARLETKIDPGLLGVSATLAPRASLDRVEAIVDREVDRLTKAVPTKAEIDRAKQQVRAWHGYEQDGVTFQGVLMSVLEALASWDAAESVVSKVEKVRAEQVREAARTYLVDDHRSIVRFHAQEVTP
jgi:zinc protease